MKVAIRRVSLASLGKVGCLLGAVAAFLPSLLCGLLALGLVSLLYNWLASWQELSIDLLGQEIARFDLVQFLGLEGALGLLQTVTSVSGAILLLAVLVLALVSGVFLAVIVALVGLAYNLLASATGGLVVEMAAVQEQQVPTHSEPAPEETNRSSFNSS
jgi:hypothetical protein